MGSSQYLRDYDLRINRRTLIRGLIAGGSLLSLGGLTGCVGGMNRLADPKMNELVVGQTNDLTSISRLAETQWKNVFRTYLEADDISNEEFNQRISERIEIAQEDTLRTLDLLEEEGFDVELNRALTNLSHLNNSLVSERETFEAKYPGIRRQPLMNTILNLTDTIYTNKKLAVAIKHIKDEGGLFEHIRQETVALSGRDFVLGASLEKFSQYTMAQQISCATASAICAAAGISAAAICTLEPNTPDCQAALAFAAAVCAAAVVACGGGGGGGEDLEP